MKKIKTRKEKNDYAKIHYHKNRLTINQKHKENRNRKQLEQRLYKYGFFFLLAIIFAHLILIQF